MMPAQREPSRPMGGLVAGQQGGQQLVGAAGARCPHGPHDGGGQGEGAADDGEPGRAQRRSPMTVMVALWALAASGLMTCTAHPTGGMMRSFETIEPVEGLVGAMK